MTHSYDHDQTCTSHRNSSGARTHRGRPRHRAALGAGLALAVLLAACGGDDSAEPSDPTGAGTSPDSEPSAELAVVAGEPFPAERCAANAAAGTITYHTGFDYAATASIIEVLVAEVAGYYDELCLDVTVTPGFSVANYPLVAANDVQFASAGSFSEVATFSEANQADLVALSVDGHVPIDALIVKPGVAAQLADLAGATFGIKGDLPPSVRAMLATAELADGEDYHTVLLDGFDPAAHLAVPDIVGMPGWKSNEPGALERAGIEFELFDPSDFGVPGSFGLIYTNREFLDAHPTAAEDFMRATLRGLNEAIADPAAAARATFELAESNGNPNFLSLDGETFRWATDAALIVDTTPAGSFPGVPIADELSIEIAAYNAVGVYPDGAPSIEGRWSDLVASLYDADGTVIWPD
ncbi:MAG TPA: ABC transporter substrate-binding protein [Ilumatobacter sp.]|nr:ABC transporter substrate-binding protein [Ilumatobacter sp.]